MNIIKKNHKKNGFSLIEILVTLSIIAVLMTTSIVIYSNVNKKNRDVKRQTDLQTLTNALERYKSDTSGSIYPISAGAVIPTSLSVLVPGGYITKLPEDPKATQNYYYESTSLNKDFKLCALLESSGHPTGNCTCVAPYNYCISKK